MLNRALIIIVLAAMLIVLFAVTLFRAESHEWYEPSCCGGNDCAPVADDVVQDRKDGVFVKGFGLLSYSDPRLRWSQDDRDHVCSVKQYDGSMKLYCVYRKFKGL